MLHVMTRIGWKSSSPCPPKARTRCVTAVVCIVMAYFCHGTLWTRSASCCTSTFAVFSSTEINQIPVSRHHRNSINIDKRDAELKQHLSKHLSKGESAIVVAVDGQVVGCLFASDTVRPAASTAVAALAQRGLSVRVASGDRREAVWSAAAAAGVPKSDCRWGATPGEVEPDS